MSYSHGESLMALMERKSTAMELIMSTPTMSLKSYFMRTESLQTLLLKLLVLDLLGLGLEPAQKDQRWLSLVQDVSSSSELDLFIEH
jgi:hypothetical protein